VVLLVGVATGGAVMGARWQKRTGLPVTVAAKPVAPAPSSPTAHPDKEPRAAATTPAGAVTNVDDLPRAQAPKHPVGVPRPARPTGLSGTAPTSRTGEQAAAAHADERQPEPPEPAPSASVTTATAPAETASAPPPVPELDVPNAPPPPPDPLIQAVKQSITEDRK
jgi:hypothetical protein